MAYISFVSKGVGEGRRPELTGGGLVRSVGGWTALKELCKEGLRIKGDERILGGGEFVAGVLRRAEQYFETRTLEASKGITVAALPERIAHHFGVDCDDL